MSSSPRPTTSLVVRLASTMSLLFFGGLGGIAHAAQPNGTRTIQIEVDKALFASGTQANNAMNRLLSQRGQAQVPTVGFAKMPLNTVPVALRRPVSLTWNGTAISMVRKVASAIGYRFVEVGSRPAVPTIVTLVVHEPAVWALQKVGERISHTARIEVDAQTHTITYVRQSGPGHLTGALIMEPK